ncbi:MAG: TIGR00730 family Rossman fold protein [Candidatus Omnitrophica bacterium]|nr:TIGR00730 family Rossman fold protein [Candidatus Omnitrophota bacterium]
MDSSLDAIYEDMLLNIDKLRKEKLDVMELRLLNTAFKELRYALKVFKPYRGIPKAAVFGSARTPKHHEIFRYARDFGKRLSKKGWMVITGGASGIMEAVMDGAGAKNSFGLNILLPFEQAASPVILGNEKLIHFKYFFTRKLMFLKESQATVLFPGGFGTFDEGFESLTLVQTGKAMPRPIVMADNPGGTFWTSTLELWKKNLTEERLISPQDLSLVRHYQDMEEAAEEVVHFYKNYHSARFFKDEYLMRFRKPIADATIERLNGEFADILSHGEFRRLESVEEDDQKDPSLGRIIFAFNRSSYSRIRQLIDVLNSL